MTSNTLKQEIEEAVPQLLRMARDLSWNIISGKCKFILTEIKNNDNFHAQRRTVKRENDKKFPVPLQLLMPILQSWYKNLHDIDLYVYKSNRDLTVIDIRCYLKSSLDKDYRQKIENNPPMLHCKVAMPPWLSKKKEKFDINWEHKLWLIKWKLFCARRKFNQ